MALPEFDVGLHQPGAAPRRVRVAAADAQQVAAVLGVPPAWLLSVQPVAPRRMRAAASTASGRALLSLRLLGQELSVLLGAGIPLLDALVTLQQKEARPAAARCLAALCDALRDGRALSDALAAQPQVFDALFIAIVRANERSGTLAPALAEHARYLAWAERLRDRLVGALIYPALLLLAGGAVVLFLMLFVLPRFATVFDGSTVSLPWASQRLFDIGLAAADHPLGVAATLATLAVAAVLAVRHPALRAATVRAAWALPGLGARLRVLALATTYRALGMLLGAGVPAVPALQLAQAVVATPLRPALVRATQRVAQGQRLSDALDAEGLATPVAQRMLRVGERSGELAAMLARAATFHDEELERLQDWLQRALNPVLMLVMGVVVGGVVVLMYLPIFQLIEQVQ